MKKMYKNLFKIGVLGIFIFALIANVSFNAENPLQLTTQQAVAQTSGGSGGSIPIQIGTKKCVCKGSSCSDANVISFRKFCGDQPQSGGSGSDWHCQQVDNGRCTG